jgi:hypothetical protein
VNQQPAENQKAVTKAPFNVKAAVTGILVGVVVAAILAAVIFATPVGPLLMGMLAISVGAGLAPILMGCAAVGIAAAIGGIVGYIVRRCTSASPYPAQQAGKPPAASAPAGSPGAPGNLPVDDQQNIASADEETPIQEEDTNEPQKFLTEITDQQIISDLKPHYPAVDGILLNKQGYVVIKKDNKCFCIQNRTGVQIHKCDLTSAGKIKPNELFPSVRELIPEGALAPVSSAPGGMPPPLQGPPPPPTPPSTPPGPPPLGSGPPPLESGPPPPPKLKPMCGKAVKPDQFNLFISGGCPEGLVIDTMGYFVDWRGPGDIAREGHRIVGQGNAYSGGIKVDENCKNEKGKYLIPVYALQELHKSGEHALPREWVDWTKTVAPTKSASAPRAPAADLALPDLQNLDVEELHDGLGVTVQTDSLIDYLVDIRSGRKVYILDKDNKPISWKAASEHGGRIPNWLIAGVQNIPSEWTCAVKEPDAKVIELTAKMGKTPRFRTVDEENIQKLGNYGITCDPKTGQLSIGDTVSSTTTGAKTGKLSTGGTPLMTSEGKPLTIRHIKNEKIPESILDENSKTLLQNSLKDKTGEQLQKEVDQAQISVDTAKKALDDFTAMEPTLPQLVKGFDEKLRQALVAAGVINDTATSDLARVAIGRKVSAVKTAANTYLLAYINGRGLNDKEDGIKKAMFDSTRIEKGERINFDAFLAVVNEYGNALKAAKQTEVPDAKNIDQNIAAAKKRVDDVFAEKKRALEKAAAELEDRKAGVTAYKKVVEVAGDT